MSFDFENVEAGQYWETRYGRKVFIAGILLASPSGRHTDYPIKGYIKRTHGWEYESWNTLGRVLGEEESDGDLIEPWVEPREFVRYIWGNDTGGTWTTLDKERPPRARKLLAVIRGKEGDGLDEKGEK